MSTRKQLTPFEQLKALDGVEVSEAGLEVELLERDETFRFSIDSDGDLLVTAPCGQVQYFSQDEARAMAYALLHMADKM